MPRYHIIATIVMPGDVGRTWGTIVQCEDLYEAIYKASENFRWEFGVPMISNSIPRNIYEDDKVLTGREVTEATKIAMEIYDI